MNLPRFTRSPSVGGGLLLVVLVAGCGPVEPGHGIRSLDATLSDGVETVVELRWQSERPGPSWVEFGLDPERVRTTPVAQDDSALHSAMLLGLPAYSNVYYEVFTEQDGELLSERGEILTGGLPAGFPDVDARLVRPDDLSPEPYMLVGLVGPESYLAAIDRSGEVLWCMPMPVGVHRMLPMTVGFDDVGAGVQVGNFFMDFLTMASAETVPPSERFTFDFSGGEVERMDLGVAHHDLVELPDGGVVTLGIDVRDWYDEDLDRVVSVMGDTVVRVEQDGHREVLFDTWDWREPKVHSRFYQISEAFGDWTHGNGLAYDATTDTLLVSLALVDTVLELDAATGDVVREFGPWGIAPPPESAFVYQHGPHWTEEGTLLMSSSVGQESRVMAIEYAVDEEAGTLEELWSYGRDEGFSSIAGGQALRMTNGNTVLNTGYRGLMVEVTPEGELVWEMGSSVGYVFVGLSFFEDFYVDLEPNR